MKENRRLKDYDDLPLVLDVADVQRIMGISRASAYELVHSPGFPAFRSGRLIRVSKKLFDVDYSSATHTAEWLRVSAKMLFFSILCASRGACYVHRLVSL